MRPDATCRHPIQIAYLDADASGQAHFASLIRDVVRRLARWAAAHCVEHSQPTEGGVCIPFTETVQVDREHKQDWRCAIIQN